MKDPDQQVATLLLPFCSGAIDIDVSKCVVASRLHAFSE